MPKILKDALRKALTEKKDDYTTFTWKGEKIKKGEKYVQKTEKFVDMSPERLQECWNHCNIMLYNKDYRNLGRYEVLQQVYSEINKCNVELLLRYYENTYLTDPSRKPILRSPILMTDLRKLMANNSEIEDWSTITISEVTSDLPSEFQNIAVSDVFDGCIDCLGAYNKERLTLTFITKMGLWFTKAEELELQGKNNIERISLAKVKFHLPESLKLRFNERGLSYHEMRAMLILPKKIKYSDMTTEQLVTLRNKILPRFQKEIDNHIASWKLLMKQIKLVANKRGIELDYNTVTNDLN